MREDGRHLVAEYLMPRRVNAQEAGQHTVRFDDHQSDVVLTMGRTLPSADLMQSVQNNRPQHQAQTWHIRANQNAQRMKTNPQTDWNERPPTRQSKEEQFPARTGIIHNNNWSGQIG